MKSTWKKYLLYSIYIIVGGGLLYGLLQIILTGYSVPWTGFGEHTLSNGEIVGEKTLWNWMELLIIPFVLAIGAFFLNRSERGIERETAEKRAELEREIAKDRQQEAALQAYIDRMSELLLKEKLRTTELKEVHDVARTRTVSVMRGLDTRRNNLVIHFLREANLIVDEKSILNGANMAEMDLQNMDFREIYLKEADLTGANLLRADLKKANLAGANLKGANLAGSNLLAADLSRARLSETRLVSANIFHANLSRAYLYDANLTGSNLQLANLSEATLVRASLSGTLLADVNLQKADLSEADLKEANLLRTDLSGANLSNAKVTPDQLAQAKSLRGATMPDGTIHE